MRGFVWLVWVFCLIVCTTVRHVLLCSWRLKKDIRGLEGRVDGSVV